VAVKIGAGFRPCQWFVAYAHSHVHAHRCGISMIFKTSPSVAYIKIQHVHLMFMEWVYTSNLVIVLQA